MKRQFQAQDACCREQLLCSHVFGISFNLRNPRLAEPHSGCEIGLREALFLAGRKQNLAELACSKQRDVHAGYFSSITNMSHRRKRRLLLWLLFTRLANICRATGMRTLSRQHLF